MNTRYIFIYQERCFKTASNCMVLGILLINSFILCLPIHAAEFGLDFRQSNTNCLAPEKPPSTDTVNFKIVALMPNPTLATAMAQSKHDSKWFVLNREGKVILYDDGETFTEIAEVLDIQDRVTTTFNGNPSEFGALGIALHPDFGENGEVYIYYTTIEQGEYFARLSRFTSLPSGLIDASSEQILLSLPLSKGIHVGGNILFGADGYLYIGVGDGGINSIGGGGNSQNTFSLMGKILRIDVNGSLPYEIPPSNPFASGSGGAPEVYAWGLRNPWRWSFDRETGDLYLGDVGQSGWEEINIVRKGGNYGWSIREGAHCWLVEFCDTAGLTDPIFEFPHPEGSTSIIGGFVYRGSAIPSLQGVYIFADRNSSLFSLGYDGQGKSFSVAILDKPGTTSFAEDKTGELYVLRSNSVSRIVPSVLAPESTFPQKLSQTGCFNPDNLTQPTSGVIPYNVNAPLWSDGAEKDRWMALPDGETIHANSDGKWQFPIGSILIKNFRFVDKLIETRFFIRHEDGEWAGYSYEWNDAQSDAVLLPGAKTKEINGQMYRFPSRNECLQCHTFASGWVLGPGTAQLNGDYTYPSTGITANQISTLAHIGLFDSEIGPIEELPKLAEPFGNAPIDERARAYLHANCSMCHQLGGSGQGPQDFRYTVPGDEMGVLMEPPTLSDLGIADAALVFPGHPEKSIVSSRIHALDLNRMPPLATSVVDVNGAQLIDDWIRSGLGFNIPDSDDDGFADNSDNCVDIYNPTQLDTDSDGYGNICDADLNNDGIVTAADYFILRSKINSSDASSDLNGDGLVTATDYLILRSMLNKQPDPSGLKQ